MSDGIRAITATPAPDDSTRLDLSEKGKDADGNQISLDRRLFMQFTALGNVDVAAVVSRMEAVSAQAVVYRDVNDPTGVGVMAYCCDPDYIVDRIQPALAGLASDGHGAEFKHEYTMLGRTYSIGYESDLEEVLIRRSIRRVCDPETPWAVYYPLRRSGMFERQPAEDQRKMLMEHGGIGRSYGEAGYAHDIRLAGHGLNKDDNDFIVGLLGKELFPLSAVVQRMRRTRQTSEFIQNMGPFFVGRAVWQPDPHTDPT